MTAILTGAVHVILLSSMFSKFDSVLRTWKRGVGHRNLLFVPGKCHARTNQPVGSSVPSRETLLILLCVRYCVD